LILPILLLGVESAQAMSFTPYVDVSVLGDAYFVGDTNQYNNGQLHGRVKLLSQDDTKKMYFDFGAGGLLGDRAESYFILPQAYFRYSFSDQVSLTVGRVVKSYSVMDDYWMLGDISPLFRWDAARPEIQGIPGLFFELKPTKNIQFEAFYSYLFLPTQGPSYGLVDGKLTSGNPWFSRPVDVLELSGVPYDLLYSVNTPPVSDIILLPSMGAILTLKTEDEDLWVRGGYFKKQRNDLGLPVEGTISVATKTGDIKIYPRAMEHKVGVADIGAKMGSWSVSASGIWESDVDLDVESNRWIYPDYSDQYKVGVNILWQVNTFHTLEAGALKTFNNSVTVKGLAGASSVDIYAYRNQYDNAVDLRWTAVFVPRQNGFLYKTKLRYAYDYKVDTSLVALDFIYKPFMAFSFFARADLFGGEQAVIDSYNNLMVNYLDKDRFQVGVQYAF